MKIVFLADVHWGAGNDGKWQTDRILNFFNYFFIPFLKNPKNEITDLVILGDWFDRRKFVNFQTLQYSKQILSELIEAVPGKVWFIVGNHDTYYKSTRSLNALYELFYGYDIEIINEITPVELDGTKFLMVPWLIGDDIQKINEYDAAICCGHFEIKGASIQGSMISSSGCRTDNFKKFRHVFTGHFHKPSRYKNCLYVGSPIQFTWNDYGDDKRIIVYNTENDEIESISTNDNSFVKIYYNNESSIKILPEVETFENKQIKLIVESNDDSFVLDNYISKIWLDNPFKIDVIEQHLFEDNENQDSSEIMERDTLSIILDYVDLMDINDGNKVKIKNKMTSLYTEANNI